MADRIVFAYPEMDEAANKIDTASSDYAQAANTLISALEAASASWEGDSKNKFSNLLENSIKPYICTQVPQMVTGLATLLRSNATTMQNADAEIAKNIPDSI
jgi:WXG100 family type VII secretion target